MFLFLHRIVDINSLNFQLIFVRNYHTGKPWLFFFSIDQLGMNDVVVLFYCWYWWTNHVAKQSFDNQNTDTHVAWMFMNKQLC